MRARSASPVGCQVSIAQGLPRAIAQAQKVGAGCFQFFTRNPRGGSARSIPQDEIVLWQEERCRTGIGSVFGHLPYTVNLAASQERVQAFSRRILVDDARRMSAIGADYMVVHPGTAVETGEEDALLNITRSVEVMLTKVAAPPKLLLETMSGRRNELGSIAQIGRILRELGSPEGVGVCLDTCHLFAAAYDFNQPREVDRMLTELSDHIGIERVFCVHVNDSKTPALSRLDRHERLGEGYIEREGFCDLLGRKELRGVPLILETPVKHFDEYAGQITLLTQWLS